MSGFVCVARRCAKKSASGFSETLFLGMGWEVILGGYRSLFLALMIRYYTALS